MEHLPHFFLMVVVGVLALLAEITASPWVRLFVAIAFTMVGVTVGYYQGRRECRDE